LEDDIDRYLSLLLEAENFKRETDPNSVLTTCVVLPAVVWFMKHYYEVPLSDQLMQDIQAARRLIIPINVYEQHWALAYADIDLGLVLYCDSLPATRESKGTGYVQEIKSFLQTLFPSPDDRLRNALVLDDMPDQQDGHSCGAFMCLAAKRFLQGEGLVMGQEDIYPFRRAMAAALSGQTL
jgi:Ulp1 family protease